MADKYYENVHDRIRDAIPGKEPLGPLRRRGRPIEDETGTGQPHVKWGSDSSPNKSAENSDDGSADDDDDRRSSRRSSRRSTRSARTRSHDEPRRRRFRARDWEADSPPPRPRGTRGPPPGYGGAPARNQTWAVPAPYGRSTALVYARGVPPPAPYDPAARYRSRSMTAPEWRPRRGSRAADDEARSKTDRIKDSIKPIAAGGAGLIAGAFIGHAAGKGDISATIAGAVLGAIGGSEAEEYWERRKEKERRKDRDRY